MRLPSKKQLQLIAAAVVAVCVIVAAVIIGLAIYHNSPGQRCVQALGAIEASDVRIAQIDTLLGSPLSTETTSQVQLATESIATAQSALDRARSLIDAIAPRTFWRTSSLDFIPGHATRRAKTAAQTERVRRSLNARYALLAVAPRLLDETSSTASALSHAAQGWQNLQDAADLTASAEQEFARQTQDAMVTSHQSSTQAADAYAQAAEQFQAAARLAPKADFSGYLAYIEQRTLMTQSALLACEDWINGHYQDANTDVNAYNSFAQAAADIAAGGLQLPSDLLATAYQQQARPLQKAYDRARAEVLRADAALR